MARINFSRVSVNMLKLLENHIIVSATYVDVVDMA